MRRTPIRKARSQASIIYKDQSIITKGKQRSAPVEPHCGISIPMACERGKGNPVPGQRSLRFSPPRCCFWKRGFCGLWGAKWAESRWRRRVEMERKQEGGETSVWTFGPWWATSSGSASGFERKREPSIVGSHGLCTWALHWRNVECVTYIQKRKKKKTSHPKPKNTALVVKQDREEKRHQNIRKAVRFPWIMAIPMAIDRKRFLQYMLAAIFLVASSRVLRWSKVFGGGKESSLAKPTRNSWLQPTRWCYY